MTSSLTSSTIMLAAEPASSTELRVTIFDEATSAASALSLVNLLLAELEFAQATSKTLSLGGYCVPSAEKLDLGEETYVIYELFGLDQSASFVRDAVADVYTARTYVFGYGFGVALPVGNLA